MYPPPARPGVPLAPRAPSPRETPTKMALRGRPRAPVSLALAKYACRMQKQANMTGNLDGHQQEERQMRKVRTAAIAGGGITGPVTALALQRAGIESTIFEAYKVNCHALRSHPVPPRGPVV